jgi:uncharacterized protein with HEPN domain
MPPRAWRVRIEDILEAMDNINLFVAGLDYQAFRADRKTVNAVERNLEIIGEAAATSSFLNVPWFQSARRRATSVP